MEDTSDGDPINDCSSTENSPASIASVKNFASRIMPSSTSRCTEIPPHGKRSSTEKV